MPHHRSALHRRCLALLVMLLAGLALPPPGHTADANPLDAVVGLRAEVPGNARTAGTLGRWRQGSAVLIDAGGLALTIGYLVLEASAVTLLDAAGREVPADVVAYDHATGFGLVRSLLPIEAAPLDIVDAPEAGEPLLAVSRAGRLEGTQVSLADRRTFAGYWEYLLDEALFTAPQHGPFGGAALIDASGGLVGIGSLRVPDADGDGRPTPGNMFVPANLLPGILADLLTLGHAGEARPWLGMTSREDADGVVVGGVSDDGPADRAGVRPGDRIMAVGGTPVRTLEMLYRGIWRLGEPGVAVPLEIERGAEKLELSVRSIDRRQFLQLDQTF